MPALHLVPPAQSVLPQLLKATILLLLVLNVVGELHCLMPGAQKHLLYPT